MIKKLDWYLLRMFLPPFVGTFFIALFVLILQVLWVYIDDIIGKGSSLFFILEMVFYLSMSLVPLALPIAVLISSVMVLGNLAERYELSSFKSAGISLARVMRPLILMTMLVGVFSFISSNYLIPVANLKGKTRLYDVRKQKPNLNLEAGTFNEDFEGYVIYAGGKSEDGQEISDILIYTDDNSRLFQVITAEKGRFISLPDERALVMQLENGRQYQELEGKDGAERKPFIQSSFTRYEKLFDLSQFELARTDEKSFRTNATVLRIDQIQAYRDSLQDLLVERGETLHKQVWPYLPPPGYVDTAGMSRSLSIRRPLRTGDGRDISGFAGQVDPVQIEQDSLLMDLTAYSSFLATFPRAQWSILLGRARAMARSVQGEAVSTNRINKEFRHGIAKYEIEVQLKYSLAVICVLFLFIGGPMGAIVRKGGFGYPILIAIIFFMLFMVLNMLFKSMAEKLIVSPFLGAWMPVFILAPVGAFLTYRAMMDTKILEVDRIVGPIVSLFRRIFVRRDKAELLTD